jgi:hypothetical protein
VELLAFTWTDAKCCLYRIPRAVWHLLTDLVGLFSHLVVLLPWSIQMCGGVRLAGR